MDGAGAHEVGAVLVVVVLEVGEVLEVVGVEVAGVKGNVGLHVVVVLDDLELVALALELVGHGVEDLCVGRGGGAHGDDIVLGGSGGGCRSCRRTR